MNSATRLTSGGNDGRHRGDDDSVATRAPATISASSPTCAAHAGGWALTRPLLGAAIVAGAGGAASRVAGTDPGRAGASAM
jgi:hypothetical protein